MLIILKSSEKANIFVPILGEARLTKPTSEVLAIPVNILPKNWQIDAYTNLSNYTEYDFTRYFINSFRCNILCCSFSRNSMHYCGIWVCQI